MFDDFFQPINLKKEEIDSSTYPSINHPKVNVDTFIDNIINTTDKQLKFECKILPYDERKCGEEIFKCPICELGAIEGRKALTEHLHYHQQQYKPCDGKHLCCLCGKELSSNSSLERHLLTHSNHRPFDCHICGKKFTTNGNLSRHVKASHQNELSNEISPLQCNKSEWHQTMSPSLSSPRSPLSSLFNPSVYNTWPPPNIQVPTTNNVFLRILESSLKVYNKALFSNISDDILNLSTKSKLPVTTDNKFGVMNPSIECHSTTELTVVSAKKMAQKISQKYRGRRNNFIKKSSKSFPLIYDSPLDLSIHRKSSSPITSEPNSFLSQSPDALIVSLPTSCVESTLSPKHKKNSYKDAPKLIRCPMMGCSQKFPWNSSLMRHILTHTAHKPFRCIRCSKCFSTKSNRERHMHRVHGIRVNRQMTKSTRSSESSYCDMTEVVNVLKHLDQDGFLSEREWLEMSTSDRHAENISHNLLKEAGEPVIEPNPFRQHSQMKMLLKIT